MDEGSRPIRARVRDGCRPHRSWPVSLAVFDCGLRQVFVRLLPAKTVKTCLDFLIGSWVKLVLEVKSTGLGQRNVFKWSCFSAAVLKKEEREERESCVGPVGVRSHTGTSIQLLVRTCGTVPSPRYLLFLDLEPDSDLYHIFVTVAVEAGANPRTAWTVLQSLRPHTDTGIFHVPSSSRKKHISFHPAFTLNIDPLFFSLGP